jgi:CBS domain-containing protein
MKQIGEMKVADFMTRSVVSIDDTEKFTRAIRTMDDNRLTVLPVVNGQGVVVGLVSATDLIEIFHEIQSDLGALPLVSAATQKLLLKMLIDQGDSTTVMDVMTSPVETVVAETNLVVAARKMNDLKYHHLPVVDKQGRPIGMLSTMDLTRALAENGSLLAG